MTTSSFVSPESLLWTSSLIPMWQLQSQFLDGRAEFWSSWNHLYWAPYLKHSRNVWWKKSWNTRLVSKLNSWVLFPLVVKICFDSIFPPTFKKCYPTGVLLLLLFFACMVFDENICHHLSHRFFLYCIGFLRPFQDFLLCFGFYSLIMMSKSMFSLSVFYLKFAEFSASANTCPLPNLENFLY